MLDDKDVSVHPYNKCTARHGCHVCNSSTVGGGGAEELQFEVSLGYIAGFCGIKRTSNKHPPPKPQMCHFDVDVNRRKLCSWGRGEEVNGEFSVLSHEFCCASNGSKKIKSIKKIPLRTQRNTDWEPQISPFHPRAEAHAAARIVIAVSCAGTGSSVLSQSHFHHWAAPGFQSSSLYGTDISPIVTSHYPA
jgi:hypothetical protein